MHELGESSAENGIVIIVTSSENEIYVVLHLKVRESTCQKKIWVDDTKKISFSCYHFSYAGFAAVFDF